MLQQNDHNSVINIVTQTKLQQYDVVMMNSTVKYCTISPVILEEIIQFQSGFALLTTPPTPGRCKKSIKIMRHWTFYSKLAAW